MPASGPSISDVHLNVIFEDAYAQGSADETSWWSSPGITYMTISCFGIDSVVGCHVACSVFDLAWVHYIALL